MIKRFILVMVIMLLMSASTACNIPNQIPSDAIQPSVAIDGTWKAVPFGDRGGALMIVTGIQEKTLSFELYVYQYSRYIEENEEKTMILNRISSTATYEDGQYRFSVDGDTGLGGISTLVGTISVEDEKLVITYERIQCKEPYKAELFNGSTVPKISYENSTLQVFLPKEFTLIPEEKTGEALKEMPFFEDEVHLPFAKNCTPEDVDLILGTPIEVSISEYYTGSLLITRKYENAELALIQFGTAGEEKYILQSYRTTSYDLAPTVRNIKIGDDVSKVLSHFMRGKEKRDIINMDSESTLEVLYGMPYNAHDNGQVKYKGGKPVEVCYYAGDAGLIYLLDETGKIFSIQYRFSY